MMEYRMQYRCSLPFISSHWHPAAEGTTSTLCTNGYPYKVLLPNFRVCDVKWWGGRCTGVCGGSRSAPPKQNGLLWVGQPTQVSWRRPGDPDYSSGEHWRQWEHDWDTHCSKEQQGTIQNTQTHVQLHRVFTIFTVMPFLNVCITEVKEVAVFQK